MERGKSWRARKSPAYSKNSETGRAQRGTTSPSDSCSIRVCESLELASLDVGDVQGLKAITARGTATK